MKHRLCRFPAAVVAALALAGCTPPDAPDQPEPIAAADLGELVARAGAPLFEGMGNHHRPVTTSDPGAQLTASTF